MKTTIETNEEPINWDSKHSQLVQLINGEVNLVVLVDPQGKDSISINFSGTVIISEGSSSRYVGEYDVEWSKRLFKKFNGVIKITQ